MSDIGFKFGWNKKLFKSKQQKQRIKRLKEKDKAAKKAKIKSQKEKIRNDKIAQKKLKKWQKEYNRRMSFTMITFAFIIVLSEVQICASYILAYLGRDEIAEALSSNIVSVIIGVTIPYFIKVLIENLSKHTTMFGENLVDKNGDGKIDINDIPPEMREAFKLKFGENFSFDPKIMQSQVKEKNNDINIDVDNMIHNISNNSDDIYEKNKYKSSEEETDDGTEIVSDDSENIVTDDISSVAPD